MLLHNYNEKNVIFGENTYSMKPYELLVLKNGKGCQQ